MPEQLIVIPRTPSLNRSKCPDPTRHPKLALYLPCEPASYGRVECWTPNEGHCEADYGYYQETAPPYAFEAEVVKLIEQYQRVVGPQYVVVRRQRFPHDWRRHAWPR